MSNTGDRQDNGLSSSFDDHLDDALKAIWQGQSEALDRLVGEEEADGAGVGKVLQEMMQAPARAATDRPPPTQIGPYRILREIGRGGMGVVYEAQQQQPQRLVALKVVRGSQYASEQHVKLFRREIQTLARLNHPNIAAIYDAGCTNDGEHFFAMELVHGVALLDYVIGRRDEGPQPPLPTRERLMLFIKVCEAIAYAHQRGVIHRDLKPSNILIDAQGNPKVLDFGLARITDSDISLTTIVTEPGRIVGTLTYMSPEQARGRAEEIDVRSDVYSLGVMLYQMLADQLPYDLSSSSLHEAVRSICETLPPNPRRLHPGLPEDLSTIVMKALEKEPDRRYPSPLALAEDIERFLSGLPIVARPPTAIYQLRKLIGRHKVPFAFIALLFALVTTVAIWMSILYRESDRLRLAAERSRDAEQTQRQVAEVNLSRTEDAEREARTAARQAERINTFLQDMLAAADPEHAQGRDVTVRELLDQAGQTIGTALAAEPEVDISVRMVIGTTYRSLGRYGEAEAQFRTALDTANTLSSPSPSTWRAKQARIMIDLGGVLADQEKFAEAETLLTQGVDALRESLGDEHPDTIAGRTRIAILRWKEGRYAEAETLLRSDFEQLRRTLGDDHPATIRECNMLALILNDQGKYAEAEPLFSRLLDWNLDHRGAQHPHTGRAYNNLAWNLQRSGRYVEAEALQRKALDIWRSVLGESHPETGLGLNNLGLTLNLQNKFAEAQSTFREALQVNTVALGEDHTQTAASRIGLGWALHELGQHKEAGELIDQALASLEGTGREPDLLAQAHEVKGRGLNLQGRFAEAEESIRKALDVGVRVRQEDHPDTIRLYNELAFALSKQNKHVEAEPLFRKALEANLRVLGEQHPGTLVPMHNLAAVLEKQGKASEAEPIYRRVVEFAEKVLPQGHWMTAVFHGTLGNCLITLERYDEAEQHLLTAYEGLKASLGEAHERTKSVRANLVKLYEAWGKPEEAEKYR